MKRYLAELDTRMDAYERRNPHWKNQAIFWLLESGLKCLRHWIESPRSEASWERSIVSYHYGVDWNWQATETDFQIHYGHVRSDDSPAKASQVINRIIVETIIQTTLQRMTLGVAWQKQGRGYRRLLPEEIVTELKKIRSGRQRAAAIEALDRPWSMGATDFGIDESIIKKGGAISKKMQRELQEATQRMIPSPDLQLSVNGHPLQLTLILQVYPLVVDVKRKNAYYPLTVGFNVSPKVARGQNALALMQEQWAQPAKWSRRDQKEFWRVLFEALHKLGEALKPAEPPPVKEAVLTISAKLKVTVDPTDPAGGRAAVEKLMRQLGETGQVVEMQHAWNGNSGIGEDLTSLLALVDTAHTAAEKGIALERLVAALFQRVPGFTVRTNQRTETEEIDLVIINGSNEPRWRDGTPLILVECKNWSGKCGKNEIVQFRDKLVSRSGQCRLGFLVSWGGFAETLPKDMLRNSKGDAVIVPIERKRLEQACTSGDVLAMLCGAWEAAVLT